MRYAVSTHATVDWLVFSALPDLGQRGQHHRLQQDVRQCRERQHAQRQRRVLAVMTFGMRHPVEPPRLRPAVVDRETLAESDSASYQRNAWIPVIAAPTTSAWMSAVPS